jgi:hypothetical protein
LERGYKPFDFFANHPSDGERQEGPHASLDHEFRCGGENFVWVYHVENRRIGSNNDPGHHTHEPRAFLS